MAASISKLVALPGATWTSSEAAMFDDGSGSTAEVERPIPTFVIEHPKGVVLFDTGVHPKVCESPDDHWGGVARAIKLRCTRDLIVDAQLAAHGYLPSDIDYVVMSHLHLDHTGGMGFFPHARFVVLDREMAFAANPPEAFRPFYIADEIAAASGFAWTEVPPATDLFGDGSVVLLEGRGHTPGTGALRVELANAGTLILAGDVLHVRSQFDGERALACDVDHAAARSSIVALKELQDSGAARVWVPHDASDWASYPHVLD